MYITTNTANQSAEKRKRGVLFSDPGGNSGVNLACQAEEVPILINVVQKKLEIAIMIIFGQYMR